MNEQITFTDLEYQVMADKMEKAINTLSCARRYPNPTISMNTASIYQDVNEDKSCNTIGCMAGHYLLGKMTKVTVKHFNDETKILTDIKGKELHFADGANLFARDLGFSNKDHIKKWANNNPHIWGNKWGGYMFSTDSAYDNYSKDKLTLDTIIKHLSTVTERLRNPSKRITLTGT